MTLIIGKGSIEEQVKKERREREQIRRQEDIHGGLTKTSGPARPDYRQARENDKIMADYKRFKNPKDREVIKKAYFAEQERWKELQRGG